MYRERFVSVVIAAAGLSSRMKTRINKQFLDINNKPVLAHTIGAFNSCDLVDEIILVCQELEIENCSKNIVARYGYDKVKKIIAGGPSREASVYRGLKVLDPKADIVLSHDGARPFISEEKIVDSILGVVEYRACVLGVPVKDTIKVVEKGQVYNTPNRDLLWAIQTPQSFEKDIILRAYENAFREGFQGTDDSFLVESMGIAVKVLMGDYNNIKITTIEDMLLADNIANRRDRFEDLKDREGV